MPHCLICNSLLDKFETEVCNACRKEKSKPTEAELEELKGVLSELEWDTTVSMGYKNISGGFAEATYFDYDADYFDVELKHGVQSDCEHTTHTEQFKINRTTLEIEDV